MASGLNTVPTKGLDLERSLWDVNEWSQEFRDGSLTFKAQWVHITSHQKENRSIFPTVVFFGIPCVRTEYTSQALRSQSNTWVLASFRASLSRVPRLPSQRWSLAEDESGVIGIWTEQMRKRREKVAKVS